MKILLAIPARYKSTRFPGKILATINGKPMIEWVVRGAQKSSLVKDVVVMTDDEKIFKTVKELGVNAVMTSDKCETGTDRIYEGLIDLEKQGKTYDFVVNVQGDEPLISEKHLDPVFKRIVEDKNLQMITLGTKLSKNEIYNLNCVKVLVDQNQHAIYFSRFAIPFSRIDDSKQKFDTQNKLQSRSLLKHIGLYGYSVNFLRKYCATKMSLAEQSEGLEQLRALDLGTKIVVLETDQISIGIDTPDDLKNIEAKIKNGEVKLS